MSIVDELISLLGLEIDPKAESTAAQFGDILGKITGVAIGVGAALAAATTAVTVFAMAQTKAIVETGDFADTVQLSIERVQELDYAAGQVGASSDALRADLSALNKSMSSDIPGEYNAALYRLGISARDAAGHVKSVDEVFLEIADHLKGMSARKQMQFADQLGLSSESLKLIRQGREGIAKLSAEARSLGVIYDKTAREQAERFNSALEKTKFIVGGLGKALAIGLIPLLTEGVEAFTAFIQANSDWIQLGITQVATGAAEGFGMIADAIGAVIKYVTDMTGGLIKLDGPLDATGAIAIAVAIGIGALAVALIAAHLPLIAITAGVVALVLVFEDVRNALSGQPSLIGEWASSFAKAYPGITAGLEAIWDGLVKVGGFVGDVLVEEFERYKEVASAVLDFVGNSFKNIFGAIEDIVNGKNPFEVLQELAQKSFDNLMQLVSSIASALFAPLPPAMQQTFDDVYAIGVAAFDALFAFIDNLFLGLPSTVAGILNDVIKAITDGLSGANPFDVLLTMLSSIKDRIVNEAMHLGSDLVSSIAGGLNMFGMGGESAPSGAASGGTASASPGVGASSASVGAPLLSSGGGSTTNSVTQYINGAGDPNAVGQSVINKAGLSTTVQEQSPGSRGPVVR